VEGAELISLCGGRVVFPNPEARICEYCDLEVYYGYDDLHSIDNTITRQDIEATKRLQSMIDRYGQQESSSILSSSEIPVILSRIPNLDLADVQWQDVKRDIEKLLGVFFRIDGVGLAKTVKILHLKRPNLFPILDSYVVEFLRESLTNTPKRGLAELGLRALDLARNTTPMIRLSGKLRRIC